MTVKDIDKGWRNLVASVPGLNKAEVKVGIQSDAGVGEDETPIVEYAFYNEFGTDDGIPPRPFIRDTSDENRAKWNRIVDAALNSVLTKGTSLDRALSIVGEVAEKDIKKGITSGNWTPNSAATIARKGSSKPLIDTGAMRSAVRYEVKT